MKSNDNIKFLLNKYDTDMLGYLLFDEAACVIFSIHDYDDVLHGPLTIEYHDLSYVSLPNTVKCLDDIVSLVYRRSEICEVRGYYHYLDEMRDVISSTQRKNVIYLPLWVDDRIVPFQLRLVNFEEEKVYLGMLTRDESYNLEQLMADSYKDSLSGLFNKNAMEFHLSITKEDHYFGFMDIDGFKAFNDTFSHATGDEIIKKVGKALIKASDSNIIFYRYGGDEFCFMTNHIHNDEQAKIYVKKIQDAMKTIVFFDAKINFSIGISKYNDAVPPYTPKEALQLADLAMYSAKKEGGNQAYYLPIEEGVKIVKSGNLNALLKEKEKSKRFK